MNGVRFVGRAVYGVSVSSRVVLLTALALAPWAPGAADVSSSRVTELAPPGQMLLSSADAGSTGGTVARATVASLDIPDVEDLVARVTQQMPVFWEIGEFRIIAKANQGDPINPRTLVRFEADAAPKADLFTATGDSVGPFAVVLKTLKRDGARTLHGTMELSYRAGQWNGEALIENPVDRLGQPVGFFPGPILELGSERQTEIVAAMRSEAIGAAQTALEAELLRISAKQEERADRLRAEGAAAVRRLEQEYADRLESQAEANAQALAEMEAAFQSQLSALQKQYEPLVTSAQERLDADAARYSDQLAARRADLQKLHDGEMDALTEAHAKAMGETKARQAQELTELETGYDVLKQALEERISAADEIITKQEAVIAKNETIADNNAWIEQLAAAAIAKRTEDLGGLLGVWRGVADCGEEQFGVEFVAQEMHGAGVRGEYSDSSIYTRNRGRVTDQAVLSMNERSLVIPASLTLTLAGGNPRDHRLQTADLTLDDTGRLTGKNRGKPECTFALSR